MTTATTVTAAATTTNPLREGLIAQRVSAPCVVVIFGASGDLTKRKLVPALYSLARDHLLPSALAIVGVARSEMGDDAFRTAMRETTGQFARRRPVEDSVWQSFSSGLYYQKGDLSRKDDLVALKARLDEVDKKHGTQGNRLFYLSIQPSLYATAVRMLGEAGLINHDRSGPFTRVIIEKPFGRDLASAQALNREVQSVLREDQTFRIDHYLGKETVQNIMVLRFANAIFEPLWNHKYVDHVQMTVAEAIGIEGRGDYFEEAGIVRDMVQNHMFQFFSLFAMEPPVAFEANAIRDEKAKLLRALRPFETAADVERNVVRGQYAAGSAGGEKKTGYHDERGVKPDSSTETYVGMRIFIDNWRWSGVPFYLRAGKALPKRVTEISIQFRDAPPLYYGEQHGALREGAHKVHGMSGIVASNALTIRIQPDEGISLRFTSKVPGQALEVTPVSMEFRYGSSFGAEPPEAYERLILDCLLGDPTLFTRADEVEASWAWIDRVEDAFKAGAVGLATYPFGSWGPAEADELLARDGHTWRRP